MLHKAFTEHPASVGETYTVHFGQAWGFGSTMVLAGFACILHGVFPALFQRTGSKAIQDLHRRMVTHRDRRVASAHVVAPSAEPAE